MWTARSALAKLALRFVSGGSRTENIFNSRQTQLLHVSHRLFRLLQSPAATFSQALRGSCGSRLFRPPISPSLSEETDPAPVKIDGKKEGDITATNLANLPEDVKVIAANGDLIFHVDPQNENFRDQDQDHGGNQPQNAHKSKLLVSSSYLIGGLPVFRELLEPLLHNRQISGAANTPLELTLKDDQRGAITDLCILLHGGSPPDLLAMSCSSRILAFAKAEHKYGCASYFSFHAQALLYQALHDSGFADNLSQVLHEIAAAAYLFDNARLFELATARLVTEVASEIGDAQVISSVPKEVWRMFISP